MNIRIATTAKPEAAPKGKRSIRETVYGNTNAYISGRFWRTIGVTYAAADEESLARFYSIVTR